MDNIADVSKAPWAKMMEDNIAKMLQTDVKGIALQIITKDGGCIRSYWHISTVETYGVAHVLELDADAAFIDKTSEDGDDEYDDD